MVSEPLVPSAAGEVPLGVNTVAINRLADHLTVQAATPAQYRGLGVVEFQFSSSDPDAPWPLPIMFIGSPEQLRRMGRLVNQIACRAANLAEGRP